MAQKTIVHLVDDLDGGDADETVNFGLDGAQYEIDLSKENASRLREALASFVGSARRTGGRAGRRAAAASGAPSRRANSDRTNDIRQWARANGYTVSDRGRIAQSVVEAYDAAH